MENPTMTSGERKRNQLKLAVLIKEDSTRFIMHMIRIYENQKHPDL
jgi:hypothetical protein